MMVEADAQHQALAELLAQRQQLAGMAAHRAHGVGQHQGAQTPRQHVAQHRRQGAIEKGLAAGEAHLLQRHARRRRLAQTGRHLGRQEVDQRVVLRAALDVAALAGDAAERAGVEPERPQRRQGDDATPFPPGRQARIAKLRRVERAQGRIAANRPAQTRRRGREGGGRCCLLRCARVEEVARDRWSIGFPAPIAPPRGSAHRKEERTRRRGQGGARGSLRPGEGGVAGPAELGRVGTRFETIGHMQARAVEPLLRPGSRITSEESNDSGSAHPRTGTIPDLRRLDCRARGHGQRRHGEAGIFAFPQAWPCLVRSVGLCG